MTSRSLHRVVVTGLGCLTPYGAGPSTAWSGVTSRACPLSWNPQLQHVVGQVSDDAIAHIAAPERREKGRVVLWSELAANQAVEDAGIRGADHIDTLVSVGTGVVDLELIGEAWKGLQGRRTSPFFVPRILNNLPAGYVAMKFGARGGAECLSTACATGVHSIGSAFERVRTGSARRAIAGSTEGAVTPLGVHGFERMRALARGEEATSCPFDTGRSGFVMSEGAAFVVLERADDAMKRGARIYAEVAGYGISSDITHITSPPEDGSGLRLAMWRAIQDGGALPEQISYVNAHATSTRVGDAAECVAISALLPHRPAVSSNKGHLGHLLAAAGSIETLLTVLALYHRRLPETLHLTESDCAPVRHVKKGGEDLDGKEHYALVNSSGFGGTNAVLLLKTFSE